MIFHKQYLGWILQEVILLRLNQWIGLYLQSIIVQWKHTDPIIVYLVPPFEIPLSLPLSTH